MEIKGYAVEKRVSISTAKMTLNTLVELGEPVTILKNGTEKSVLIPHGKYIDMFRLWHDTYCNDINEKADNYFETLTKFKE